MSAVSSIVGDITFITGPGDAYVIKESSRKVRTCQGRHEKGSLARSSDIASTSTIHVNRQHRE